MTPLNHTRAEGAVVRLRGDDGLSYEIPAGRHDLVAFMKAHKPEIIAALKAEQQAMTCPACNGTGAAGTGQGRCWPCGGSGQCTHAVADALARFAGYAQSRQSVSGDHLQSDRQTP